MSVAHELLPFNFRHIPVLNKWVLTNPAGSYIYLSDRTHLEALVDGKVDALESDVIENLVSLNFISPAAEKELRSRILASRVATQLAKAISPPSLFMVVPTLRCDHDCQYCQVSRAPKDKTGFDLDFQHIDKVLGLIQQIGGKSIKIEFQGGEPLLAFDFIRRFYKRAQEILVGVETSFVICTASGPLDSSIIEWAKGKPVNFSISLDGPEGVHTFNRPSRYFNSYQSTIRSIASVKSTLGAHRVSCLATVSKNSLDYPTEIVESYFSLNLPSIFLRPLSPFGFAANTQHRTGYHAQDYMAFYTAALRYIIGLNQHRSFVEEAALIHLRRMFQPHNAHYIDLQSPAGYLFGALVFNYDGKVFGSDEARMLWQSTQAEELVLGTVNDDVKSLVMGKATHSLLASSFTWASPGCEDCAYQPYCGADPLHHLATQGDVIGDKSLSFFCQYQMAMFDLLFTLWETDMNARKVFQEWLIR